MVATILSLRWRIVRHQFSRDWWRMLFVVAGAIWSVSVIPTLLVASHALSLRTVDVKQDALVAVGTVLAFAWVVVPLLATGVDDSLEPARFAPWGIPPRRIMPGLVVASFTTVPAIFFAAVVGVMASTWRGENHGAWVMTVAVLGSALSLATWVASARLAVLWATRLLATRLAKAVLTTLALLAVALVGSTIIVVRADGLDSFLGVEMATTLTALARTPWAAGFAAPTSVALGEPWGAVWRLVMLAGWLAVLLAAWRSAVEHSLVNPVSRSGGPLRTSDGILAAVERKFPMWRATATTRAVLARSARSWRIDPRYVAQVVGAIAMPTIMGGVAVAAFGSRGPWLYALPIVLGITIGWGRHNDLAYDASAAWLDIVSGVRGAEVVRGRLLATAGWAAPSVAVMCVVAAAFTGRWEALLPVLVAAWGVLGISLGIAAISSVLLPYRVPASGENPFGAEPGSIGASLGAQAASSLATGIAVPFVVGPLVAAFMWGGPWWIAAVAVGVLCGGGGMWAGTHIAGALYDKRAGRLISMVS